VPKLKIKPTIEQNNNKPINETIDGTIARIITSFEAKNKKKLSDFKFNLFKKY
jgi:hypothetical protein